MRTTHHQVRTIIDMVGDRARALLGTKPQSPNWHLAVRNLTQALQQAQALIKQGRGPISWNLWRKFINATTNASVFLSQEKRKANANGNWNTAQHQAARMDYDLDLHPLGTDEDEEMVFTTEEAEGMQAGKSPEVQAAERAEQRAFTQDFVSKEREAIARGEIQASTALEARDSFADFWAMLNPPDTPIYSRPIFLFAAAGASLAVYVYGSKYMEQQEAAPGSRPGRLPERRLA